MILSAHFVILLNTVGDAKVFSAHIRSTARGKWSVSAQHINNSYYTVLAEVL